MGNTQHCGSYPYTLNIYRSNRTIVTLDLLGPSLTFSGLYTGSLKQLLLACENGVDAALIRAADCLGTSLPDAASLKKAIRDVHTLLDNQTSMRWLIEHPKSDWPAGVDTAIETLFTTGLYINCHMVPDTAKTTLANYFADSGEGFLASLGSLALKDYFERPRNTYTGDELALLARGRRLGVLMCHESAIASTDSTKRRCWNGFDCVPSPDNKQCNGNTGSSDIC